MKSSEARIGEAEAALRHRLTTWGVDDVAARAHEFVTDLLREGWRPIAHAVRTRPPESQHAHPNTAAREAQVAREEIAAARAQFAAREEGRRLASQREDLIARGVDPAELLVPIYPEDIQ